MPTHCFTGLLAQVRASFSRGVVCMGSIGFSEAIDFQRRVLEPIYLILVLIEYKFDILVLNLENPERFETHQFRILSTPLFFLLAQLG